MVQRDDHDGLHLRGAIAEFMQPPKLLDIGTRSILEPDIHALILETYRNSRVAVVDLTGVLTTGLVVNPYANDALGYLAEHGYQLVVMSVDPRKKVFESMAAFHDRFPGNPLTHALVLAGENYCDGSVDNITEIIQRSRTFSLLNEKEALEMSSLDHPRDLLDRKPLFLFFPKGRYLLMMPVGIMRQP